MRRMVLAVLAASAIGGAALAAEPLAVRKAGRASRADLEALRAEIGLSDDQAAEIRRVALQERKARIHRQAQMRIARLELDELLRAEPLDDAAIAARVKALGELQAASVKARADGRLAIRRAVSAEQYQRLQQLKEKRRAMRARRVRPLRRPAGPEGSSFGPGPNDALGTVHPA